jgi:hypothetical protein
VDVAAADEPKGLPNIPPPALADCLPPLAIGVFGALMAPPSKVCGEVPEGDGACDRLKGDLLLLRPGRAGSRRKADEEEGFAGAEGDEVLGVFGWDHDEAEDVRDCG